MASIELEQVNVSYYLQKKFLGQKRNRNKLGASIDNSGRFLELKALRDLTLHIKDGDKIGLIGTNGSGKSTLLKLCAGALSQKSGTVNITGSISPQFSTMSGLRPTLSGRRNAELKCLYLGKPADKIVGLVEHVAELSDLGEFFDLPMSAYSAGMRSRLAMALMSIMAGDILIMDEWINASDATVNETANLLQTELMTSSSILVAASHSERILRDWTDKLVWLHRGELIDFDSVETVFRRYNRFVQNPGILITAAERKRQQEAPGASAEAFDEDADDKLALDQNVLQAQGAKLDAPEVPMPQQPKIAAEEKKSPNAVDSLKVFAERNTASAKFQKLLDLEFGAVCAPGSVADRTLNQRNFLSELSKLPPTESNIYKHALIDAGMANMPPEFAWTSSTPVFDERFIHQKIMTLFISQHPLCWAYSLFARPVANLFEIPDDFTDFLTSSWLSVGRENALPFYPNPLALWTFKTRAYLTYMEKAEEAGAVVMMLRGEDVVMAPADAMQKIADKAGWRMNNNLKQSDLEIGKNLPISTDSWRTAYSKHALDVAKRHLDPELMDRLGYSLEL